MANALTLSLAHGARKRVMRATHPMTARNYGNKQRSCPYRKLHLGDEELIL